MRNKANRLMALLIVLGAISHSAQATVDSLYNDDSMCKVFSVNDNKTVRMIFASQSSSPTYVQVYNKKDDLIYDERVESGDFVRNYDLSSNPAGEYKFIVGSRAEKHEQVIVLGFEDADSIFAPDVDLAKARFVLTSADDQYALVGKNESGAKVRFQIIDEEGRKIYFGKVNNNEEVKTLFDFSKVADEELTFKFFIDGQLIKEKLVDL